MFEKLLSALPYNPSIIHQLSFYSKRLRKEESVRKVGLVLIVLTFLIQFFAFVSPPQTSSADVSNDLVNGGLCQPGQADSICRTNATNACRSNLDSYGTILATYGITCDRVADSTTVKINSDAYGGTLWSMGRDPAGIPGETTVCAPDVIPCPKGDAYFVRYLKGWDKVGTSSNYYALDVTMPGGQTFFLLYTCGNLVSVGYPAAVTPPTPPPPPKTPLPCAKAISTEDTQACLVFHKTVANLTDPSTKGKTAKANDLLRYDLYADNTGTATVKDYTFTDNLSYVEDYAHIAVPGTGVYNSTTQILTYPPRGILPGQTASVYFEVRVNSPIPQTPTPQSDPFLFNMTLRNTFGNTVVTTLPSSPTQTIEAVTGATSTPTAATSLPNTGPGEGVGIAAALTIFVGFFYYRSRLLSKESRIAIKETVGGF